RRWCPGSGAGRPHGPSGTRVPTRSTRSGSWRRCVWRARGRSARSRAARLSGSSAATTTGSPTPARAGSSRAPGRVRAVRRGRATSGAVGHASADEIDAIGIMAALRLAGRRALGTLEVRPDLVILDGNHDWLTDPGEVGLFADLGEGPSVPPVTTMIKADMA